MDLVLIDARRPSSVACHRYLESGTRREEAPPPKPPCGQYDSAHHDPDESGRSDGKLVKELSRYESNGIFHRFIRHE